MYVIRGPGGFGASEVVARPRRGRGDPAGLLRGLRPLAMTSEKSRRGAPRGPWRPGGILRGLRPLALTSEKSRREAPQGPWRPGGIASGPAAPRNDFGKESPRSEEHTPE